jgi:MFS family permease
MSDEEWDRWQSAWQAEKRPMPKVLARARSDRRRAIVGMAVFSVLVAGEIASAIAILAHSPAPLAVASAVLVLAMSIGLTFGAFLAMRGTWAASGGAPLALLDELERRHAARRRLMMVTVVGTAFIVTGTLVVGVLAWQKGDPAALLRHVATSAFTVGFVWLVNRRVGRKIEQELRDAGEARRLLLDSSPGLEEEPPLS